MPTLVLRFPGGRYHATPWGHHVNEGLVEWPPSPWRLLRALLSAGYTALGWPAGGPPDEACRLVEKLATAPPRYRLPPASGAHTRHYMPIGEIDKTRGVEKTTLVFDTWAQLGNGELAVHWDVALTEDEARVLAQLADRLGYLGRSESWVDARLADTDEINADVFDCAPCELGELRAAGWEQVAVLAPETAERFTAWRQALLAKALADPPAIPEPLPPLGNASKAEKDSAKLATKAFKAREAERKKAAATFSAKHPADLVACLQVSTDRLRVHGWSQPPGSRKLFYWRRTDSLEPAAPLPRHSATVALPVEAMLLSMAAASRNDHALPGVLRALPQAELLHRALVSTVARAGQPVPSMLSGVDATGLPLSGPHGHAHILPLDLDGDGHLEHVLIWAPMGLDANTQAAVHGVRRTFTKGGVGPLQLAVAASGSLKDLCGLRGDAGVLIGSIIAPQGSKVWVSQTPFVAPRYLKTRGSNTLQGQITAELASRGHPAPAKIEVLDLKARPDWMRFRHFILKRRNGPRPPTDYAYALRITFPEKVHGPLCLGYGSHFGLGLFAVAADFCE